MRIIVLWLALSCAGCGVDVRDAPSAEIRDLVTRQEAGSSSRENVLIAPELQVRRFRMRFYGYDTVYYYLLAETSEQNPAVPVYYLVIDANYGGRARHYETLKTAGAVSNPANHLRHDTVRCQIFGDMTDSCLYRDRADFVLNPGLLQAAVKTGLTLTLASAANTVYETLDLPANYIDGFLQAVQTDNARAFCKDAATTACRPTQP
ncbi:MAG: hypothetical protein PHW13_12990 [Methylococcales bacterium]|nr:hypothetical protein [Methylococcales bacterium]